MKVAVIFTGFFRTFPFVKQTFKNFIMDPLKPDVFFSTPKTLFTTPQHEDPKRVIERPYHSANDKLVAPEIIDFFGDRLKSYELTDYDSIPFKSLCAYNNIPYYNMNNDPTFRILSQLTSQELSIKVFKDYVDQHNITYDLVLMTRGDTKFFTPFNMSLIDFDRIGYPDHNWNQKTFNYLLPTCKPSDKIPKAFNDQFLAGSQKNMLIWSNIAQKSFDYFREGMYFSTENLMAYHLMKNNIDWYGARYIEYSLWRNEEYE